MRLKRLLITPAILVLATCAPQFGIPAQGQQASAPTNPAVAPDAPNAPGGCLQCLTLTTPAFDDGSIIPPKFTQSVSNPISPELQWSVVPSGTVSFLLILHDPDTSPNKGTDDVLHWLIFNIPGTSRGLPEGVPGTPRLADGSIQLKNRKAFVGYLGPGALAGRPYHHYTFELFALDTTLNLGPDATRADVMQAVNGHILAKGSLVGRFHE
jgi:Raf kinase inhibitor-like YbhB/YbcL family protein